MPGACPSVSPALAQTALLPDFEAMARLIEICSFKPVCAFDGLKA
jgi:hypothetical protein